MAHLLPTLRLFPAVLLTVVLALLSAHSFFLSSILTVTVLFILHPLYFWGIHKPSLFPFWAAFLIGFLLDLEARNLLGLNAFVFVFAALLLSRQQRYLRSQSFATQWAAFFVIALAAELVRWLVMMVDGWTVFSPASGLVSGLISAALYPVSALVMQGCLRLISPHSSERQL